MEGHYCNCAVGKDRYFVISFWPYEEEAIRTIWEGVKVLREAKKSQRMLEKENKSLKAQVSQLQRRLSEQQLIADNERDLRIEAYKQAERLRRMQQRQEWQRNERLRYRDPIHIYALEDNASGTCAKDWKLIVDYHKGAHNIQLSPADPHNATQELEITENDSIYLFDLIAPRNLSSLGLLPVVPSKLCEKF
uniref:Uncharacterized protein n=1 Tax=Vannella robusta TaxID=1487602 RepID=A0A7S4IU71_9EUKA